ncbi:peptidase M50 [[Mycobacterium] holstebronense]|uniref:Peptidase M50 n=1 Tax=[Mycobacterium] holstebronense TaxID=3064288 RepID=A0ABM9LD91_9MYCO|nr:peptidase M50 [Mycolicibacter sp. MU0102]CAJ1497072.1 peptidase M50 [Mycolicibacter sp. MU0102]
MPPETVVLLFAGRPLPRPLRGLPTVQVGDDPGTDDLNALDAAIARYRRLVVVGADAHLAQTLTRLLRTDRLDVELGYAPRRRTPATAAYRLTTGWRAARRARRGSAAPVPLVRDDAGTALVGVGRWLPVDGAAVLHGEGIVDDAALFDGEVTEVLIEPMGIAPGVRAGVPDRRGRVRRWVAGRAAQLGTTGALVVRDGIYSSRTVKRSTFYRHIEDWLVVR